VETCDVCGFGWATVSRDQIGGRIGAGVSAIVDLLTSDPSHVGVRPSTRRWSAIEYAGHVRDVLFMLRDRLVVGLVEDLPSFKPMYRDERVDLGLYKADTIAAMADELRTGATMFTRLFGAIDPDQLNRDVLYGWPEPTRRSILWMAQQAVHEIEHHRLDIVEDLELVAPGR
jgi:hypothetical protein